MLYNICNELKEVYMKKSIFKLFFLSLFVFSIAFALASCGDSDKINKAIKNTRELSCVDADVYIDMVFTTPKNNGENEAVLQIQKVNNVSYTTDKNGKVEAHIVSKDYEGKDEEHIYFDSENVYFEDSTKISILEYEKYNTNYVKLIKALLSSMPSEAFERDKEENMLASISQAGDILFVSLKAQGNDSNSVQKSKRELISSMLSSFTSGVFWKFDNCLFCSQCQSIKAGCDECSTKSYNDCQSCISKMITCEKCNIREFKFTANSVDLKIENGYVTELSVNFDIFLKPKDGETLTVKGGRIGIVINNPGKEIAVNMPLGFENFVYSDTKKRPSLLELIK